MTSATDELRRLLDERGVVWGASDTYRLLVTSWSDASGHSWAFMEHRDGSFNKLTAYHLTPKQAIAVTLGPAYEPPVAMHWNGDVLTLTIPRDPSCIRVQRSAEQPCKVYADESKVIAATLGSCNCSDNCTNGERTETCHPVISDNLNESEGMGDAWADCSECGHLLFVLTDPNSEPPNYCPNCGKRVVEPTTNDVDAEVDE